MEISFHSHKLSREFNDFRLLVKRYGDQQARRIRQRMDDLRAAECLADISHLPPHRLHELSANKSGVFSIDVIHPYRLLLEPANEPMPHKTDGGIDLTQVTTVRILGVEDTHG